MRNHKILFLLVSLLILVVLPISIYLVFISNDIDEGLVKQQEEIFMERYAFSEDKDAQDIHLTFTGDSHLQENYAALLKDFSDLEIDLGGLEDEYRSLEELKIYKTDQRSEEVFTTSRIEDTILRQNLKGTTDTMIDYPYIYSESDVFIPQEYYDQNESIGDVNRKYYYELGKHEVMNLGTEVTGNIRKDQYVDYIVINRNVNPDIKFKEIASSAKVPYTDLNERIENGKGVLYRIENLGKDYISENPVISEYGIDAGSKIKIHSLEAEYIYIWESQYALPILRLDGIVNTNEGELQVSFWLWYLKS